MIVELLKYPTSEDWSEVRRRAMITIYGKGLGFNYEEPDFSWKQRILEARHSPIRYLQYSFLFQDIPSNISVHLCRHIHAQPYVSSLRNDRQTQMDGDSAPRNTPVNMIIDVNAEELMIIANKRLCNKASVKTREAVQEMCRLASEATPEISRMLIPMCEFHGGVCHEMMPCGRLVET